MKKFLFVLILCIVSLSSCRHSTSGTRVVNGNTGHATQTKSSSNKKLSIDKEYNASSRTVKEYTFIDGNGCKRKLWVMYSDALAQEHMPDCANPNCPYKQHKSE